MNSRFVRLTVASMLSLASTLVGNPSSAQAVIGPYTLPFFYAYQNVVTQDYLNGVHSGIDYSMVIGSWVASSDNGTADAYQEWVPNGGADQYGGGNYFFLKHGTNLYSLYYHLKYNGVIFNGCCTGISEGQHIAYSGDTGAGPAHLHYQLNTTNVIGCPLQNCDIDPRQWTTNPGRVPWRADLVGQHQASYSVFTITTFSTWVDLKNIGGRPWARVNDAYARNRIVLASMTPPPTPQRTPFAERVSPFYTAGDWEQNWLPGMPNGSVAIAVDTTARFTFLMDAPSSTGTYTERYNLKAAGNFWFDYWEASSINGYKITITVNPCC